jgi:hypothetical protein
METIIFIAIAVIVSIIQNKAEKAKKNSSPPSPWLSRKATPSQDVEEDEDEEQTDEESPPQDSTFSPSRKLQEYIRQFEEAQREAAQGTMAPPTPPPIKFDQTDPYLPHSLRELAEEVIQSDVIDAEYLMDQFEMTEGEAISALNELEKLRVIGRDMGNGEHDVLVHDVTELNNLFKREQKESVSKSEPSVTAAPASATTPAANDKQSQLKILEERARRAREEAAAAARQSDRENGYTGEAIEISDPLTKRTAVRSISRESVRRGFIWGKVIDEPRFKKRWSPISR